MSVWMQVFLHSNIWSIFTTHRSQIFFGRKSSFDIWNQTPNRKKNIQLVHYVYVEHTAVGKNVRTLKSNCLCSASLSNKFIFAPSRNEQNRHRSVNAVKFNSSLWGSCCCWFVNIAFAMILIYLKRCKW